MYEIVYDILVERNGGSVKNADFSKPSNYSSAGPFFVLHYIFESLYMQCNRPVYNRVKCNKIAQISYLYKI